MRLTTLWAAASAVLALAVAGGALAAPDPMTGHWEGELVQKGKALPIRYDLFPGPSGLAGRFSAETWGVMDYPLDQVTVSGDRLTFHMGDDAFEGVITGDTMAGRFKGEDEAGTFALHRVAAPTPPYREIAVSFRNGDVVLSGTLAMPATPGRHPAVVLVHGSGAEVRWGTSRYIADRFARAGIAALVYDKRGTGQSTGDWRFASYEDLAGDALAGVALLAARPEIDPARVGIHGHSEGGIVAPIAATRAPDKVAFIVAEDTVAGRIRDQDLYRVTNDIATQDWSAADKKSALDLYALFLDAITGQKPYAEYEAALAAAKGQRWLDYLGLPPHDHWLWKQYPARGGYDTRTPWPSLKRPVLLVYGEHDQVVPVGESVRRFEDILDAAGTPYTALIVPRAEHNLTIHPRPGEPFFWWRQAPGLIETVVAWVAHCTAAGGPCRTD